MNAIKITAGNRERIQTVINDVQKRSRVRTIIPASIYVTVAVAEEHLRRSLYKKDWTGLVVECDPNSQTFANAYKRKGVPESTRFTIERRKTGWFLTKVSRARCGLKYLRCSFAGRGEQLERFATDQFGR